MDFITYIWILLGCTMLLAYFAQKYIAEKLNIPSVAIFMILGVILGGSGTHLYTQKIYENLGFISDIVLGIISFIIGTELSPQVLKKLGKPIIFVAIGEVVVAALLVIWGILYFTNLPLHTALMLGAVASATAPAATVFVIQNYKSKGPLTSTLLGVVGVDDAFSLILFSFVAVIAHNLLLGTTEIQAGAVLLQASVQIGLAVLFGVLGGVVFSLIAKFTRREESLFIVVFAFIVLLTGIAKYFEISQLLILMVFGMISVTINDKITEKTKHQLDQTYGLLTPIFFILAGSTFSWKYAVATFSVGLIYTVARAAGKYVGAYAGASLSGLNQKTSRLVGLGLLPQVGVAFGLSIVIHSTFGTGKFGQAGINMSLVISNILIWTTLLTETIGPVLTKWALQSAGEIGQDGGSAERSRMQERKLTR